MGVTEALAAFLTRGAAWAPVRGGGGGAPEGRRESCQNWLAQSMHILGKERESLWMKKFQEAAERVAFSLPTCL